MLRQRNIVVSISAPSPEKHTQSGNVIRGIEYSSSFKMRQNDYKAKIYPIREKFK